MLQVSIHYVTLFIKDLSALSRREVHLLKYLWRSLMVALSSFVFAQEKDQSQEIARRPTAM